MQKLNREDFTWETYLDSVDDLRDDEECCFLDQMSIPTNDLDGVQHQPMILAPPSTCQTRENQW